jgi:hypothetical protein
MGKGSHMPLEPKDRRFTNRRSFGYLVSWVTCTGVPGDYTS